jgi:hypothetical protein
VDNLVKRHIEATARQLLEHFPVLVIEGARQVGKSTLAAILAQGREATFANLDDRMARQAADEDPAGFAAAAARATGAQFASLRRLRQLLGDRFSAGVVLAPAVAGYRFGDRLYGLPVAALWQPWA